MTAQSRAYKPRVRGLAVQSAPSCLESVCVRQPEVVTLTPGALPSICVVGVSVTFRSSFL